MELDQVNAMPVSADEFTFDGDRRELRRNGMPVKLSSKAFEILWLLVERRPDVVSNREILRQVWPDAVVEEGNVKDLIAQIRRALGDDPKTARFIRTHHRMGYAFCGDVAAPERNSGFALVSGRRVYPLAVGANTIGRAGECAVAVESAEVSRRHACLTVTPRGATIDDLGSKNGTFVNGARIRDSAVLRDGDQVSLGQLDFRFRAAPALTTRTRPRHVPESAR